MKSPICLALAAASLVLGASSCGSGGTTAPPAELLSLVVASSSTVFANGVNTVTLRATTSGSGPIAISTTRGSFADTGTQGTTIAGASGEVVLTTCNAVADSTCAGEALVTAFRPGTSASAKLKFDGPALCATNCSVDSAGCAGHTCSSPAVASGICAGGACVPPPTVTVAPRRGSVLANGTNTVTFDVSTTGRGPISVTTDRGSLDVASVDGTSGTVVLRTCNSANVTGCAGKATVTATDVSNAKAQASVDFGGMQLCASDCGVDAPACAGYACSSATVASGICSAGTCRPPPTVTVSAFPTSVLANGTNSVTITVATTGTGPITLTTDRGTFPGRVKTASVTGTSGSVVLTTCSSAAEPNCAGSATITAEDGTGNTKMAQVAFDDLASGAAIAVAPGRARLPADGVNTTPVVVKVTRSGVAVAGVPVGIATTLGSLSASSAVTGTDGTATVTFTSSAASGVATISAVMTDVPRVTASAAITMPALGPIQIGTGGVQYPVMGVRGSGYRELGAVSLAVLDDQGKSYPDGLTVHFEHMQLGGSTVGGTAPGSAATCATPAGCVAFDARTDTAGIAQATLSSGAVAGTLLVTVSATAGGITRTFNVPNVAVIGAKANGGSFSIVCSPRNIPALAETDCSRSLVDAQFTCAALLKDRFNNLLGTQTQVTFVAEAASVGQVATTPAYDPNQPPTAQTGLGVATQVFETLGGRLPIDVAPVAGEPRAVHALDGCGTRTHNPRDGVLTVIAIADGEESFVDVNGNGVYDGPGSTNLPAAWRSSGEPFIDAGEPFVDANDNGQWDDGEWYLDVDQSRSYTGPNGVWDGNTKLWTQTVVVYTGVPAGSLDVPEPFVDRNGNGAYDPAEPFVDANGNGAYDSGEDYTDSNGNQQYDPAEVFTDLNGSGRYDATGAAYLGTRWIDAGSASACAPSAIPAEFAVGGTGAASQRYTVTASDLNLNLLTSATTYGAATVSPGRVGTTYRGQPRYADDLGFFFQYWPCDKSGVCAAQCSATGSNLPCVMKPSITAYSCGFAESVDLTAASPADGTNVVNWTVSTPYPVYLSSKIANRVVGLTGKSN